MIQFFVTLVPLDVFTLVPLGFGSVFANSAFTGWTRRLMVPPWLGMWEAVGEPNNP